MPTASLMPLPKQQFLTTLGTPLLGGRVYTYDAGTTNPRPTYSDAAGTVAQANPIVLNARGEPDSAVYWSGAYKVEVRDALGNVVYTVDNYNSDPSGLIAKLQNLAASGGALLIGFILAAAGAVARTVQSKLSDTINVRDFGAKGDGVADDTAAFTAAINYCLSKNGGKIIIPEGRFLLNGAAGADGVKNGILYPYTSYGGTDNRILIEGSGRSTVLLAGSDNMIVVRMSNCFCGLENLSIDGNGKAGVIAQAVYPQDLTQTTTRTDQSYNYSRGIHIRNCTEGIVMRNGPKVGALDGACWYNSFTDYHILDTLRGIWLRGPTGGGGSATPNRNKFTNIRIGSGGAVVNTGVQIDGGNTNIFLGVDCEGVLGGAAPNATPTAFKVVKNDPISGADNNGNRFVACTLEACTRDFDNNNFYTEIIGCNFTGSKMLLTTVPVIVQGGSFADSPQVFPGYSFQSNNYLPGVQPVTMQLQYGRLGFPPAQNPSADPNTLDDYEEGTFAPTLTAAGATGYTYASQVGSFIKIGRVVMFEAYVELSGYTAAGSNYFRMGGLPFSSQVGAHKERSVSVNIGRLTGMVAGQYVTAYIGPGTTEVNLNYQDANGEVGVTGLNAARITGTTWVRVAGSYMTDN